MLDINSPQNLGMERHGKATNDPDFTASIQANWSSWNSNCIWTGATSASDSQLQISAALEEIPQVVEDYCVFQLNTTIN